MATLWKWRAASNFALAYEVAVLHGRWRQKLLPCPPWHCPTLCLLSICTSSPLACLSAAGLLCLTDPNGLRRLFQRYLSVYFCGVFFCFVLFCCLVFWWFCFCFCLPPTHTAGEITCAHRLLEIDEMKWVSEWRIHKLRTSGIFWDDSISGC